MEGPTLSQDVSVQLEYTSNRNVFYISPAHVALMPFGSMSTKFWLTLLYNIISCNSLSPQGSLPTKIQLPPHEPDMYVCTFTQLNQAMVLVQRVILPNHETLHLVYSPQDSPTLWCKTHLHNSTHTQYVGTYVPISPYGSVTKNENYLLFTIYFHETKSLKTSTTFREIIAPTLQNAAIGTSIEQEKLYSLICPRPLLVHPRYSIMNSKMNVNPTTTYIFIPKLSNHLRAKTREKIKLLNTIPSSPIRTQKFRYCVTTSNSTTEQNSERKFDRSITLTLFANQLTSDYILMPNGSLKNKPQTSKSRIKIKPPHLISNNAINSADEDEILRSDSEENSLSHNVAKIVIDGIEKLKQESPSQFKKYRQPSADRVSAENSPSKNSESSSALSTPKRKSESPIFAEQKKQKMMNGQPSFSDIIQSKKELFVIDIRPDGEQEVLLTEAHCKLIKASFSKELFADDRIEDLDFEFTGFDKGRLRVVCENEYSRDWIIKTLPLLKDLWKDVKLKHVEVGAPPKLYKATFSLSYPTPEPTELFNIIGKQNRLIDTSFWRIYNRKRGLNDKQHWTVGIDEKSVVAIRALNNKVKFGMDKIRFGLEYYNNDLPK